MSCVSFIIMVILLESTVILNSILLVAEYCCNVLFQLKAKTKTSLLLYLKYEMYFSSE